MPKKRVFLPKGKSIAEIGFVNFVKMIGNRRVFHHRIKALIWNPKELHELFLKARSNEYFNG